MFLSFSSCAWAGGARPRLFQEIKARGYRGSFSNHERFLAKWRNPNRKPVKMVAVQILGMARQKGSDLHEDQAASAAFQISGAVVPAAPNLLSANWPFLSAIVIAAWRNRLNPTIGPKRSLIDR
nr:hypothetical protein [Methylosinus sp. LW4]